MLDDDAEAFLAGRTRYAMLTTIRADGSPITVPVWYAWDGQRVEMFSGATSPKLARLRRNPWASVLVSNEVDEPENWVAFDGEAGIVDEGGFDLAERIAPHYWDLSDPTRAAALASWREAGNEGFRRIVLAPSRVRTMPAE